MSELHSIPEAIEAIRQGEIIIVVDDEDRENEGDFLMPRGTPPLKWSTSWPPMDGA